MFLNANITSGSARIVMPNLFDFTMYHGFMKSCAPLLNSAAVRNIEVELRGVDCPDDFVLDMLMLLKERATAANKSLSLHSPSIPLARVLSAHFSEMFNIRSTAGACTEKGQPPCVAAQGKYAKGLQASLPVFGTGDIR
jgi:hypothetical protein